MKNKLQYDEQYGYWSYYVDDNLIYDLKEVEINGKKYKVIEADNTDVSYEMGHHDIVHSTKYHIKVPFEGTTVLVDLTQLLNRKVPDWMRGKKRISKVKAKVIATKFSTEKPKPAVTKRRII
jgi:cell division protein ZapA (FtsZ GTPase activity inhibitor)